MNKIILLLLLLIAGFVKGTPCHAQTEVNNDSLRHEFIMKIVTDPHFNSLYVALPINKEIYVKPFFYLRKFLTNGRNLSSEEAVKLIEDMLDGKSDIVWDLDNVYGRHVNIRNSKYIEVPEVSEVAKKGKEYFINYYFRDNLILKNSVIFGKDDINEVTQKEKKKVSKTFRQKEKAIIYYLFQWRVPCRNDCETGTLIIDYNKL